MIAQKKSMLLPFLVIGIAFSSNAQKNSDIGVLISPFYPYSGAFEYRVPIKKNDKYLLKYGLSVTQKSNFNLENGEILFANDSTVRERRSVDYSQTISFRFGAERTLKESIFSLYADLNVGYRHQKLFYHSTTYQLEEGVWVKPITAQYEEGTDPSQSSLKRHYLTTDARFGVAMNLPINKYFLLNLFAGASFGLPIYMGESNKIGPEEDFKGVPITFDANTNVGIGLRYKIGVNKD